MEMKKILVVDDTEFMRMTIRRVLESANFEIVAEAENGEVAVRKYKTHHPDIVLMDITMPIMNGIEALKEIKAIDASAKVVIVSALGQEMVVREAIANGAETFIVKPFQPETLVELVSRVAQS